MLFRQKPIELYPTKYPNTMQIKVDTSQKVILNSEFPSWKLKKNHIPIIWVQADTGLWVALMIFSGVAGATIVSFILGYSKKYKEVGVVSLGLAVLCFIWFSQVSAV